MYSKLQDQSLDQALAALQAIAKHHSDNPTTTFEADWRAQEAVHELNLLGLPAEIRLEIYSYLLVDVEPLKPTAKRHKSTIHPAIIQTCKQIRLECLPILYGTNNFTFELYSARDYHTFSTFLTNLHTVGLAWISNLKIKSKMQFDTSCEDSHGCGKKHIFNVNYVLNPATRILVCGTVQRDYSILMPGETLVEMVDEAIRTQCAVKVHNLDTAFTDLDSQGMGDISEDSAVGSNKETKWSRFKELAAVVELMCTQHCQFVIERDHACPNGLSCRKDAHGPLVRVRA